MLTVNGCDASYWCCYRFIVDFHPLKGKWQRKECMQYNLRLISNVLFHKIKLIRHKIEILEEVLIVNGCDASYWCCYRFIVDFHPLKAEITKERTHAIQCEA